VKHLVVPIEPCHPIVRPPATARRVVAIPKRPPTLRHRDAINQKQQWPPPHAGSVDPPSIHPPHSQHAPPTTAHPSPARYRHYRGEASAGRMQRRAKRQNQRFLRGRQKATYCLYLCVRVLWCFGPPRCWLLNRRCDVCGQEPKAQWDEGGDSAVPSICLTRHEGRRNGNGHPQSPRALGSSSPARGRRVSSLPICCSLSFMLSSCVLLQLSNARIHHMRQIAEGW
jgi:hypothetical protein